MVKTLCQAAGIASITSANTTQFWKVAGRVLTNTTEVNVQVVFRTAGVFSNLLVTLTGNTIAATSTITFRKNAADGSQVLSIPSNTSGEFEDTTHTDTIAASDKVSIKTVPGAATGTYSILIISLLFAATADTVTKLATHQPGALATASTSWFFALHGAIETLTEATVKCRQRKAGVLKNMAVHVTTARATNSTARSRKNGANGNLVVTLTASTTGWFEDTTNTDTISAGEDWNYSVTTGTGVDTLQLRDITTEFVSTNGDGVCVCSTTTPIVVADATNTNFYPSGIMVSNTTESQTQTKARETFICSELTCLITQNGVSLASTLDFRVDAAASALTVSITGNTTGVFSDSINTVTLTTANKINTKITVPSVAGSNTVTIANASFWTHMDLIASASFIYKNKILGRVSLSRIYVNKILSRITLSRIYKNKILARISLSRIYKNKIVGRISLSRIYKNKILSRISLSRIYKNKILSRVSLSRIYKNRILTRVSLSRIYKNKILSRVSLTRIYINKIVVPLIRVSLERIYKNKIQARVSLSRTYKNKIFGRISLSRIYKNKIVGRISLSRIYRNKILIRVSLSRIYKNKILGRISLSRIYKNKILRRVSLTRIYSNSILSRVSLTRIYINKISNLFRVSKPVTYINKIVGRVSLTRVYINVIHLGIVQRYVRFGVREGIPRAGSFLRKLYDRTTN